MQSNDLPSRRCVLLVSVGCVVAAFESAIQLVRVGDVRQLNVTDIFSQRFKALCVSYLPSGLNATVGGALNWFPHSKPNPAADKSEISRRNTLRAMIEAEAYEHSEAA